MESRTILETMMIRLTNKITRTTCKPSPPARSSRLFRISTKDTSARTIRRLTQSSRLKSTRSKPTWAPKLKLALLASRKPITVRSTTTLWAALPKVAQRHRRPSTALPQPTESRRQGFTRMQSARTSTLYSTPLSPSDPVLPCIGTPTLLKAPTSLRSTSSLRSSTTWPATTFQYRQTSQTASSRQSSRQPNTPCRSRTRAICTTLKEVSKEEI